MSSRAPAALGLILLSLGCGVSRKVPLPAGGRIDAAVLNTYGWTSLDLAQDIEIKLRRDASLDDVIDMSMFGQFRPGFTHEDARRVAGKPRRVRTDEWGEEWYVYVLPQSEVEIGCYYHTSGGTPSACTWSLHSVPKGEPLRVVIDVQLTDYLKRGIEAEPDVSTRSLDIATADGVQSVRLFLTSRIGPGAYWYDRTRSVRRESPPRGAAQQ